MPEWLQLAVYDQTSVSWTTVAMRLFSALLLGAIITVIYRSTRKRSNITPTFPATLILLCVLIAMVTQVIGDNVARAFSLVGALSIVRFRTVVRDTKDTAFVIFAVVVGMAVGAGQSMVASLGMITVTLAAVLFRDTSGFSAIDREMILLVRIGWSQELESAIVEVVTKHSAAVEPIGAATIRQGAAIELSYRVRLASDMSPTDLIAQLNRLDGVQGIELRSEREQV